MAYIAGDMLAKYDVFQKFFNDPTNSREFHHILNDVEFPMHRSKLTIIHDLNHELQLSNFHEHLARAEYRSFFGNGKGSIAKHEDHCNALRIARSMYTLLQVN